MILFIGFIFFWPCKNLFVSEILARIKWVFSDVGGDCISISHIAKCLREGFGCRSVPVRIPCMVKCSLYSFRSPCLSFLIGPQLCLHQQRICLLCVARWKNKASNSHLFFFLPLLLLLPCCLLVLPILLLLLALLLWPFPFCLMGMMCQHGQHSTETLLFWLGIDGLAWVEISNLSFCYFSMLKDTISPLLFT